MSNFVQSGSWANVFGSTAVTVTLGSSTSGNILLMEIHYQQDNATTGPPTVSGWTLLKNVPGVTCTGVSSYRTGAAVYGLDATGGAVSATVTEASGGGSAVLSARIHEYNTGTTLAGGAHDSAADGTSSATTGTSGTTTGAGSTTTTNSLIFATASGPGLNGSSNVGMGAQTTPWTDLGQQQNATSSAPSSTAYQFVTSAGTQSITWSHTSSGEYAAVLVALKSSAPVTPPVITIPTAGTNVANGSSLTITGTTFQTPQGAGSVTIDTAAQTATSWSDTSVTIGTVTRGLLAYGSHALSLTNNSGNTSAGIAINLVPQSGWAYVNLTTPFATAGDRITAVADLASGDQLAYDTKGGAITVNPDASFVDSTGTVTSFNIEAWTPGSGWGAQATQTLSGTPLAGAGSVSTTGQGTLTRGGALMGGSASVAAAGAGTLTTFAALSGGGAVVARGQGTLTLGSSGASLAGSGSVSTFGTATLTLGPSGASLAGAASVPTSAQGTLSTYAALSGAASIKASGSGTLTVPNPGASLAGSGSVIPFGTGTLTIGPPVSIYSASVRAFAFPADTYPPQPPVISIVPRVIPVDRPQCTHDPRATLDYCWNLSALIEPNDSIASATFALCLDTPGGAPVAGATLTLGQIANGLLPQFNAVWGWLSVQDPTLVGKTLACTCQFTTTNGRTDERTFWAVLRYR